MARIARIVIPGWPHHVTQRGNNRQTVFFNNNDREVYLKILAQYKQLYRMALIGYTLMSNHVHIIPIPEFNNSLAKGIGRTNNDYSRWLNVQFNQTGHLWQARFYSCPVEFASLPDVLAYVELNAIRASIVKRPEDWPWSSARAHIMGKDESGLLDMEWWNNQFTPDSWADYLRQKLNNSAMLHRIRTTTQTGRPFASSKGLCQLEAFLGRSLQPRKGWQQPTDS